ncbi:MAG: BON domain-containing protein [Xanthomonadaceae bacterium]|nr:BON domain-containing protein [Xanthomonadaceae bacterium]
MNRSCLPLLLLIMVAATTSGCGALVVGGAATGGYYVAQDERSLEQISRDASITSRINASYVKDDLVSAMDVNVDTYNGVVTLRGTVPSSRAAHRAVELARAAKGVTRVISRLTVVQ